MCELIRRLWQLLMRFVLVPLANELAQFYSASDHVTTDMFLLHHDPLFEFLQIGIRFIQFCPANQAMYDKHQRIHFY